ncbi:MAG: hypothetical protein NVS1B4_11480 [Gemmatimonadaceae bacterium]
MPPAGTKAQYADPSDPARTWNVQEVARTRASMGRNQAPGCVTLEFTSGNERRLTREIPLDWPQQVGLLARAFKESEQTRDRFSFIHEGTAYHCEARPTTGASPRASAKATKRASTASVAWFVGAGSEPEVRTVDSTADDLASMKSRTELKNRILAAVGASA